MDAVTLRPATAARWRELGPPRVLRPGVAAIAWLATAFLAIFAERPSVCTPAQPCGPDWVAPFALGILVVAMLGLLLDPVLGAVAGALLAPFGLYYDARPGMGMVVAVAFGGGGVLSVLAAMVDARSRRERLALLDEAAGMARVPLPDEVRDRPLRTARLYTWGAAASVLLAAALAGWVADRTSAQRARERRAPVVDATVAAYDPGDMVVVLRTAERADELDVYGTYRAGEVVRVWDLGGDGLRPVGEPYDPSYPTVLPVFAAGLALLLARRAALVRAEVRAVRLGAPAFRVTVMRGDMGLEVLDRATDKALVALAVKTDEVEALLWPDGIDEDEEAEEVRVVVAGRLVPRGLVALRVRDQWVAPNELARVPRQVPQRRVG